MKIRKDALCLILMILMGTIGVVGYVQNQVINEQIMKNNITSFFTVSNSSDMKNLFDDSVISSVPEDYLFSFSQDISKTYGEIKDIIINDPLISKSSYSYRVNFEKGYVTGTITLKNGNGKLTGFFMNKMGFFEDYIIGITWDDIYEEFSNFSSHDNFNNSLLIAVNNSILYNFNQNSQLKVGSTFKLYVLKALNQKINNNPDINWDIKIPIQNRLKSLPSGILQNEKNGTLFSLRQLANYMINISDNTATDHLIDYLGREYIESFLPNDYDFPLLKTAEAFKLRWYIPNQNIALYKSYNEYSRREYLKNIISDINISSIDLNSINFTDNLENETVAEWGLSTNNIYHVLNETKDIPSTHMNPGLADPNVWNTIAFKGGSSPGVFALAHAMETNNGTWFYVIMTLNNFQDTDEIFVPYGQYVKNQMYATSLYEKILMKLELEN